ncbi:unnamed protein product [Sphagnum jensenii]|uniref:Uncharacterized protein n=1 Tax=Sphagnum jensenii TaxID=128206 RepID=A0ABP0V8Y5_9BRYO
MTPDDVAKSGTEEAEQTALFCWAAMPETSNKYPCLASMFAIPNGGKRDKVTAGKMRAAGVKAGVWDVFIPYAVGNYHGLWIELKVAQSIDSRATYFIPKECGNYGKEIAIARKIEDATEKHGHAVVAMAEVAELVGEGKVEVNAETLDENGNIFARATGVGNKPKPIVSEVYRAPAGFVPPAKKRQPKPEIYKFSALEVGDSFFVVGSQNGKSVAKTLTSTIAMPSVDSALKREKPSRIAKVTRFRNCVRLANSSLLTLSQDKRTMSGRLDRNSVWRASFSSSLTKTILDHQPL